MQIAGISLRNVALRYCSVGKVVEPLKSRIIMCVSEFGLSRVTKIVRVTDGARHVVAEFTKNLSGAPTQKFSFRWVFAHNIILNTTIQLLSLVFGLGSKFCVSQSGVKITRGASPGVIITCPTNREVLKLYNPGRRPLKSFKIV